MHSQKFSHPDSAQADFRAALMRASQPHNSRSRDQLAKVSAEQQFEEYDPYHNRNISSIVSKITDEGPANVHQINTKTRKKSLSRRATVDNLKLPEDTYTPSVPPQIEREKTATHSFTFGEAGFDQRMNAADQTKHSILYWSVLVLLIAAVAVIGFLLYQLTLQADDFSQALGLQKEQIMQKNVDPEKPPEVLPRLNNLGEALAELKVELNGIKVSQQEANRKLEASKPVNMLQWAIPVPIQGENLVVLKSDLKRIRNNMPGSTAGDAAVQEQERQNMPSISTDGIKTAHQAGVTNKLVVNLVSLTNRHKAQEAYDLLIQAGVSPLIEEVLVNDRKIYRLSVGGFDTRESAQLFISKVSEKYGFEGGWIRQQ